MVFVLQLGASDNLETLSPAWLLSCAQCWAFPHLSASLQIGFQSYSSDLGCPTANQRAGFSGDVFEAALSCPFCSHLYRSKWRMAATA